MRIALRSMQPELGKHTVRDVFVDRAALFVSSLHNAYSKTLRSRLAKGAQQQLGAHLLCRIFAATR